MNILILEDNEYKLENAIDVLGKHGISNYKHFDNCNEAIDFVIWEKHIKDFDLIILDLNFYMSRKLIGDFRDYPTQYAGAKFLWQMLENSLSTPVLIYSSEKDYMAIFKEYPLPSSFEEYAKSFENHPLVFSYRQIQERYESEKEAVKKKFLKLDFIIGHAHSECELDFFINQFLDSINAEDSAKTARQ